MDEVVRLATVDDIADLERLDVLARAGLHDVRGGDLLLQECPAHDWVGVLDDPDTVVLVGSLDAVVTSLLVLRLAHDRDRGIVTTVFVETDARELGLGDLMIERAVEAVVTAGLTGIEAAALPGDRATKNLYERAGITARKLIVYRDVRARGDEQQP